MALNAAIVFEIRQAGSDTNGGGFKAGASGTDWSQQNSAQYSVTDGVTAGSTTITSATAAFGTDVVGNTIYVQGGTGSVAANWYEITVRNSATSITVDRSTGLTSGTGVTLHIGGAFATPGILTSVSGGIGGVLVSGQKAWVKYSATPTACSTSTAGPSGPCNLPSGISMSVEGYDVTRGDRTGNQPIYQWTTSPGSLTYAYAPVGSGRQVLLNLCVDGNSHTNAGGFSVATRVSALQCVAINCNQSGAIGFLVTGSTVDSCFTSGCTTGFSGSGSAWGCEATGGTTGFSALTSMTKCLAYSVPTGYALSQSNSAIRQCIADTCSTAGFNISGQATLVDSLASNCTGTGFICGSNLTTLHNCATYNNVTIASGTPTVNEGPFASGSTLTSLGADPYVNQSGADFRPNANSPGGAQIRAAGIGVYGQTDNADIGAVQHTDPTGGGVVHLAGAGGGLAG